LGQSFGIDAKKAAAGSRSATLLMYRPGYLITATDPFAGGVSEETCGFVPSQGAAFMAIKREKLGCGGRWLIKIWERWRVVTSKFGRPEEAIAREREWT
jgi:hypothetical protein